MFRPSDDLVTRLRELNFCYSASIDCDTSSGRQVNQHLWRQRALYSGGDCFLADWPSRTLGRLRSYMSVAAYRQRLRATDHLDTEPSS